MLRWWWKNIHMRIRSTMHINIFFVCSRIFFFHCHYSIWLKDNWTVLWRNKYISSEFCPYKCEQKKFIVIEKSVLIHQFFFVESLFHLCLLSLNVLKFLQHREFWDKMVVKKYELVHIRHMLSSTASFPVGRIRFLNKMEKGL